MKSTIKRIYKRWIRPFVSIHLARIADVPRFIRQSRDFKARGGSISELRPILGEDTPNTDIDHHYVYQSTWLAQHLSNTKPQAHVDVGSQVSALAIISTITPITFVDIRPPRLALPHFSVIPGSLDRLPFPSASISSLSCLHVIEHIGLGRYGDPIDPQGHTKACAELERVLAPGGKLYLSVPVGVERTEFNAHRVLPPKLVISLFPACDLREFSYVDDHGNFHATTNPEHASTARYACGMFIFTKRA